MPTATKKSKAAKKEHASAKPAEQHSRITEDHIEKFASAMHLMGMKVGSTSMSWEETTEAGGYKERMRKCIRAGMEACLK